MSKGTAKSVPDRGRANTIWPLETYEAPKPSKRIWCSLASAARSATCLSLFRPTVKRIPRSSGRTLGLKWPVSFAPRVVTDSGVPPTAGTRQSAVSVEPKRMSPRSVQASPRGVVRVSQSLKTAPPWIGTL